MEKQHKSSKISKLVQPISAKPVLGLRLGNCELTFRYADQSAMKFEGELSDVTGLFLNPIMQADFKRVIFGEIRFMKSGMAEPKKPANEKTLNNGGSAELAVQTTSLAKESEEPLPQSALETARQSFEVYNFLEACRILLLDESFNHQKHLIIQVGRLEILTEYANNLDRSQWSFMRGLKYDFLADGNASTFPHKQRLRELGDIFIHVFIPEDHKGKSIVDNEILEKAKVLASIVPFIPQTVDIEQYLKAKDDIIRSKDDAIKKARFDLAEKSVRNDSGSIATSGFEERNNALTEAKRFDFLDAALILIPTIVVSLVGWSFAPFGWLAGFCLGAPMGFAAVSRRK